MEDQRYVGRSKDTIDSGFRFGQDYRLIPTVCVRLIKISVFGRKKKKRKRAKTEGENLDSSESQKNVRFEPQKDEQPRTVVKKKVRKKISTKLGWILPVMKILLFYMVENNFENTWSLSRQRHIFNHLK